MTPPPNDPIPNPPNAQPDAPAAPADDPRRGIQPTLAGQTETLGLMLKGIADQNPTATPTLLAAAAFAAWLREVGPDSQHPDRFADVRAHFNPQANDNRDIYRLFQMLQSSVNVPDDDPPEPAPPRAFIDLPLAPS